MLLLGAPILVIALCLNSSIARAASDEAESAPSEDVAVDLQLDTLSKEELETLASETRQALIQVRLDRQALRYQLERDDSGVREIMDEMTELRRKLHEKNQELEELLSEHEGYDGYSVREHELVDALHRIGGEIRNRQTPSEVEE